MKENKIQRMKTLVHQLSKAAYAYEQTNTEIMSNYEYDKLYDELAKLEKETGIILAGSVTQKVGYEVVSSLPKVTHQKKMLSLDKTKEITKLQSFLGNHEGMLSWKLDGLTIVCTYEKGNLIRAVTRGNGTIGEDVTNNAKTFKNLPLTIPYKETLTIRGEALIHYSDFFRMNDELSEKEEKYKNPRNLCSGSVRQLDTSITARRNVYLYVFSVVEVKETLETKQEELQWLENQGFQVVESKLVNKDNLSETVEQFSKQISQKDFASDGLVLTYNDKIYGASLGETAKFPRDSIAFKWQDEIRETKLLKMEWNTSRTGLINPVAVFEPVELEGTTVERASVHNLSILNELELGIGDSITVYKANMIIPQIAQNLSKTGPVQTPIHCPVCGAHTIIKQERNSKTLYCPNGNCQAQRVRAMVHFTSRDAMNIEGLSEATIEKLLEKEYLTDFASLYHLSVYKEQIIKMEGFGEKSYTKLIRNIEKSREVFLPNFIYALGIQQVGFNTAKVICEALGDNLDSIRNAKEETFMQINGIGPIIAKEMEDYFTLEANTQMLQKLLLEITFKHKENLVKRTPLQGNTFVITGDVYQFANRKELQVYIENLGGKVTGSVTSKTTYLISNDKDSNTGKTKKAKSLNIPILTEEEFLALL